MQAILEIISGPAAGARKELSAGEPCKVGRLPGVDWVIGDDAMLSNAHFSLEWSGTGWRLRDLGSRFGTKVNGSSVKEIINLKDGDEIAAGRTTFLVRLEGEREAGSGERPSSSPRMRGEGGGEREAESRSLAVEAPFIPPVTGGKSGVDAAADEFTEKVLFTLRNDAQPLYALLDAARDPNILALLRELQPEHQSLYEGLDGELLAEYAPYLVRLPANAPLLNPLVARGWGKSWGVYLTCDAPFAEVRKHFRRFLLVRNEKGKELYFRFYDPRVLRVFLPACSAEEVGEFFGPIKSFRLEAQDAARMITIVPDASGARLETIGK